jgi:hypothetical protein
MDFFTKYRTEFTDILGLDWQVDIEEYAAVSGTITPMKATGDPLNIEYFSDSDELLDNPIKGSTSKISVYSDTDFEWVNIYDTGDLTLRMSVYYGPTPTLYWQGFITANTYSEPYDGTSYPVVIEASDGLGRLKDLPYDNAGVPYSGRKTISQILIDILAKVRITEFTEYVNVYETTISSGATDSMFDQVMIDVNLFNGMSCYDALKELLKPFNAVIRQANTKMIIYRPLELTQTTVKGRRFTSATVHEAAPDLTPEQFISRNGSSDLRSTDGGTLTVQAAAKKITTNQDFGNKDSWLDNWDLQPDTFDGTDFRGWTRGGSCVIDSLGPNFIEGAGGMLIKSHNNYLLTYPWSKYVSQTFGTHAKTTSNEINISFDYLLYNTTSTNRNGEVIIVEIQSDNTTGGHHDWLYGIDSQYAGWVGYADYLAITANAPIGSSGWKTYSATILGSIPITGSYTIKIFALNSIGGGWDDIYLGIKNVKFYSTSNTLKGKNKRIFWGALQRWPRRTLWANFTHKNITENQIVLNNSINGLDIEYDYKLGDVGTADTDIDNIIEQFQGNLVTNTTPIVPTVVWSTISPGWESLPLISLISNEVQAQYTRPKQILSLPILENNIVTNNPQIKLLGCFKDTLNTYSAVIREFVFNKGTFNVRDRKWDIDLIEII